MYKNTKEKGITLVVLVITIILLLILAGITISYITGGGLIDKTQIAMNEYENADKKQQDIIDDINDYNKQEIDLEPVYEEEGAEDNIAPADLFEYEIINDGSVATTYMDKLPTKTVRIKGIKAEYCNVNGYDPIKDETNPELTNTFYEIIYNGNKIEDVLIIPYQVELDENANVTENGEMYKVTEVDLSVISSYMNRKYGSVFPDVKKIVYPNTVEKINIRNDYTITTYAENNQLSTKPQEFILSRNLTNIPNMTFAACKDLKSIDIPDSVTSIGNYAFYESGITNIEIPSSVTSIGDSAFEGCYALKNVEIPDSITSISDYAFYESGITNIEIPSSVTNIGSSAFKSCELLTSIEIPDSVTSIGDSAFYYSGITSIKIPSSITSIGYETFRGCESLTSIEIPESVTRIDDYAFTGCENITKIIIPESVEYIGDSVFAEWGENNEQTIYFECSEEEAKNWSSDWKGWWFYANIVWDYNPDETAE